VYSVLDTLIKVVDNCVREIGIGRETLKPFPIEITEEDASTLSKIINSGTWIDQPAECESDCEINLKGHMVYYNSANGILNVYNLKELSTYSSKELEVGGKSLVLSEEDRTTVNTILEKYITLGFKSN